jgi:hypothetical protein
MIQTTLEALESRGMVRYTSGGAYVPTEWGWKLLTEIKTIKEEFFARGHPNVAATDQVTMVITKDNDIKKEIGAVVAVGSEKASRDLKYESKNALKEAKRVEITIEAGEEKDKIIAYGSPALKLNNPEEITIRKDSFIDSRTVAILADKSANELKQELVEKLRKPNMAVKITLEIKP